MTIRKTILGTATLAALAAAPLAPAFAQSAADATATVDTPAASVDAQTKAQTQAQTQAPTAGAGVAAETGTETEVAEFSDAELQGFVEAASEIAKIRQDFAAQIQAANDGEQVKALQEEALTEMRAAIDSVEGLDVAQYNAIGAASQSDAEVNQRLTAMMQQHMEQEKENGEG